MSWISTDTSYYSGELQQQSIKLYTQKVEKPPPVPRVDKQGIQEHLLAIVATCDLVRSFACGLNRFLNRFPAVSFCWTPSCSRLHHLPQPYTPWQRYTKEVCDSQFSQRKGDTTRRNNIGDNWGMYSGFSMQCAVAYYMIANSVESNHYLGWMV